MAGVLSTAATTTAPKLELPDWASSPDKADLGAMAGTMQGSTDYSPSNNALVSKQIEGIISKDSPLMQQARTRAAQASNARGLMNSSIGVGAGESAVYSAATPIAQADATAYLTAERDNAAAKNTFALNQNQFQQTGALEKYRGVLNLAGQQNDFAFRAGESALERENRLSLQNDQQDFQTGESALDRQNRMDLQKDSQGFQGAQAQLDRDQQSRIQQLQETGMDRRQAEQIAAQERSQAEQLVFSREQLAEQGRLAGEELGLNRDKLNMDNAYRDKDLGLRDKELGLKEKDVNSVITQREGEARTKLAAEIAQTRRQAVDARTRIETDPNMSAEAKRAAIEAMMGAAAADIDELVRFSGIDLPEAWPSWVNDLGGGYPALPTPSPTPGGAVLPSQNPDDNKIPVANIDQGYNPLPTDVPRPPGYYQDMP